MTRPKATIDFETRSTCDLRACGSWKYSLDPTTQIMCLVYRLPYWEPGRTELWHPAFPHLALPESTDEENIFELFDWIEAGELVEAHNAWFERGIWTNILVPRYQFPPIQPNQWRCSAAKAAAHALPRHLADAGAALGLSVVKDDTGHRLMLQMSKPRKARKAEREAKVKGVLWWETREKIEELWAYCRQDVLAEEALSEAIPDLNDQESTLYGLDQQINERGFQIDRQAVKTAMKLIKRETVRLNKELYQLTGRTVKRATQRAQILRWLVESEGVDIWDTQAATIDAFLAPTCQTPVSPSARRVLQIVRLLGRSSTAKYEAMRNWMAPDGRVRGAVIYHGATTGRWTGAGVQPHNFPKGKIRDQEGLWANLMAR